MDLNIDRINDLKSKFNGLNIAVIGDVMLDCYFKGKVKRISPEAPVPVVEVEKEFFRFGGAANVAYNVQKLGGNPLLLGVIGNDTNGAVFTSLLNQAGIAPDSLYQDKARPTTAKTRIIAHNQQVVRVDQETTDNISKEANDYFVKYISENIEQIDGIILEDYNKGVLTKELIETVVSIANKYDKIVTVDPKFSNFFEYKNVTLFKPNRKETEDALQTKIKSELDLKNAGMELIKKLKAEYVLITLSEDGAAIFSKNGDLVKIPTKARKVADVSGAGDTVISTLTMALSAGANIFEAAYLGNYAGGLVCEEVGVVPIEKELLFEEIYRDLKIK